MIVSDIKMSDTITIIGNVMVFLFICYLLFAP